MDCTQPGSWSRRPDSESPDEVIEAYLEHAKSCPLHGYLEADLDRRLEFAAETAMVGPTTSTTSASDKELERLVELSCSGGRMRVLSIRTDGVEKGVIDLNTNKPQVFEFPRSSILEIWKPQDEHGHALFLGVVAMPSRLEPTTKMRLELPTGQIANLDMTLSDEGNVHCEVTSEDVRDLRFGPRLHKWFRFWTWKPVLGLGTVATALLIVGLLMNLPRHTVSNRPNGQPKSEVGTVSSGPTALPKSRDTSSRPDRITAPIEPLQKPGTKKLRSAVNTPRGVPLSMIRRIYVERPEDQFGLLIRNAILEELAAAIPALEMAADVESADGRLSIDRSAEGEYILELASGNGSLWSRRVIISEQDPKSVVPAVRQSVLELEGVLRKAKMRKAEAKKAQRHSP